MRFEIPVYNQGHKVYCQECKPQDHSTKAIEVVSGYEVCCHGCGESFREIAEKSLPCGDIEDPAVQQRLLATNERIARENRHVEEFWCLMAEAQ